MGSSAILSFKSFRLLLNLFKQIIISSFALFTTHNFCSLLEILYKLFWVSSPTSFVLEQPPYKCFWLCAEAVNQNSYLVLSDQWTNVVSIHWASVIFSGKVWFLLMFSRLLMLFSPIFMKFHNLISHLFRQFLATWSLVSCIIHNLGQNWERCCVHRFFITFFTQLALAGNCTCTHFCCIQVVL